MENEKFKNGDVVMLKSGGPLMTIYEVYTDGRFAKCYFFKKDESFRDEVFPTYALKKEEN